MEETNNTQPVGNAQPAGQDPQPVTNMDTPAAADQTDGQLLESTQADPAGANGAPAEPPNFFANPIFYFAVLLWLLVLWSMRKQKKREQERKGELDLLKKGDKVITIGRLHGTIVSLTDDTMTLKPDDKSNTTLTFDRVALHKILPRGGESTATENEK